MTRRDGSAAIWFIFITILIDAIGLGIVLPVTPKLIMELTNSSISEASVYGGWMAFSYAIMQFIFGPVVGNLSDRFGRRPVLLLSLLTFGIDYALMALAPTITWLFIGRAIAGMAGAAHSAANAYIADVSSPEKRAQNFGLMGAAFGLGFILGPALGGVMGHFGTRAPFYAAAVLALINMAYGMFVLPESLPLEARRPFHWRRANTLGTVLELRKYPAVMLLATVLFLWTLAHQVLPSTWAFYAEAKFAWTTVQIGLSLAFAGVMMAIVQAGLTRVMVPRLGEHMAVLVGLVTGGVGYLLYAVVWQGWMVYPAMVIGMFGGLTFPSLNALMSQRIPPSSQGELQGAVASLFSLTAIVGPVLMTYLFRYFTSAAAPIQFPGAAFLCAAFLVLLSIAIFVGANRPGRLQRSNAEINGGAASDLAAVSTETEA